MFEIIRHLLRTALLHLDLAHIPVSQHPPHHGEFLRLRKPDVADESLPRGLRQVRVLENLRCCLEVLLIQLKAIELPNMRFHLRQLRCNHQLHLACLHLEAAARQHSVLSHNPFTEEALLARAVGLTLVQASDMRTDASSCFSNRRLSKRLQTGSHASKPVGHPGS